MYPDHAINTVTALDDADELDKEITDIVSQANSGHTLSLQSEISIKNILEGSLRSSITDDNICFRPRPIRQATITFSPAAGELPCINNINQSGGRVSVVDQSEVEDVSCRSPDQVMVAVVSSAAHAFVKGWRKIFEAKLFDIFVDEVEEKFKDPGSGSDAGVSLVERHNADFSLVDKSLVLPSDWSEPDQPVAGFKRTAQFSGECFL